MSLAEVLAPWRDRAACRGAETIFAVMNEDNGNSDPDKVRAAKKICAICPVRADCLEWACTTPKPLVGHVAGGLSPSELRLARKRPGFARVRKQIAAARPSRCGTFEGYHDHCRHRETPCEPCREANARYRSPSMSSTGSSQIKW